MAVSSEALVTLAEAKDALGISGSGDDTRLEALIDGISLELEKRCRNRFVIRSVSEVVHSMECGKEKLYLEFPFSTITSITDQDSDTIASTDYYSVPAEGLLIYQNGLWPKPVGFWTVVYNAGLYANTAAVAADLKRIANQAIGWAFSNPSGVKSQKMGGLSVEFGEAKSAVESIPNSSLIGFIRNVHAV